MAKSGFATGFAGFLIGVVTGLGIAAGAMLVIAKSPVPFVDKVDRVTADVDPAAKLAGGVDPNARLNQQLPTHLRKQEAYVLLPLPGIQLLKQKRLLPQLKASGFRWDHSQSRVMQKQVQPTLPCRASARKSASQVPTGGSASDPLLPGLPLRKSSTVFLTRD